MRAIWLWLIDIVTAKKLNNFFTYWTTSLTTELRVNYFSNILELTPYNLFTQTIYFIIHVRWSLKIFSSKS